MLITKVYQGNVVQAAEEVNKTGLANLVFSICHVPQSKFIAEHTVVVFRDTGYPTAVFIHRKLGLAEPTTEGWLGN